jgi:allantoate deiminase
LNFDFSAPPTNRLQENQNSKSEIQNSSRKERHMQAMKLGSTIWSRIEELAGITAEPGQVTRLFLTPEQKRATEVVRVWMAEAGMAARTDALGNLIGRYEGDRPGLPALVLGSHLDTVRDAGKYDGILGVVTAIACVEALHQRRMRLPFAIEVVGFSDEEGVRFGSTLLGSRAFAGTFESSLLDSRDSQGLTVGDALRGFGLDPAAIPTAARSRRDILAYVELHIEQGPVLEKLGLPVGCVTSINGAARFKVEVSGKAGHAGTVPMAGRQDALVAAAECILGVERRCAGEEGLVGTVGVIEALPGAVNVIPGQVRFSLDLRAPEDAQRQRAVRDVTCEFQRIAQSRKVDINAAQSHEAAAIPCSPWIMAQIDRAIEVEGVVPHHLASGAGHDGMAVAAITDIGMIFVRCAGGVSHSPAEAITMADAEIGARVLLSFIENFQTARSA